MNERCETYEWCSSFAPFAAHVSAQQKVRDLKQQLDAYLWHQDGSKLAGNRGDHANPPHAPPAVSGLLPLSSAAESKAPSTLTKRTLRAEVCESVCPQSQLCMQPLRLRSENCPVLARIPENGRPVCDYRINPAQSVLHA